MPKLPKMRKISVSKKSILLKFVIYGVTLLIFPTLLFAQEAEKAGNFVGKMARPLRYRPENREFVIENGREFFNRPLYGGNTAFRVDVGDKPEILLYLPGRGGNLRFAVKTAKAAKWLFDADRITTRYRAGAMIYEIRDSLFGKGQLKLTVLATYQTEGLIIRAELENADMPLELIWVYGGASGERGRRDGDIGTEKVPISEFFQFKPEFCKDNKFSIEANNFTLDSKPARITGLMPKDTRLSIADAAKWNSLNELLTSTDQATETPIVVGRKILSSQPLFLSLSVNKLATGKPAGINESQQATETSNQKTPLGYKSEDLPRIFDETENYRRAVAEKVVTETPDPFIDAAVSALNAAADGVWDEPQGAFMHGAVAWRNKLLGWRGAYSGDALGWHDRMRRHLEYWATRQNLSPVSDAPIKPDAAVNFARNEPELHSNGDLSNSHYDMNIVYIDALFRHILWTGDVEFARKMFPVIQRHLAWEKRLFRRELGAEKLPLYEAYVCIWASDDLQYGGGGVTHSSAYNYYHNQMAARIAKLIGEDAAPYEQEAGLILKAMRQNLWLKDRGWYGEFKDLLGLQQVHENAALWTFYHTVDSEAVTPFEAWQMARFVDTQIPHIPIQGANVPNGDYYTLSTTSWMPYAWSTNNVVMAEAMHTSLGFWQTGRRAEAFKLYKGAILNSMFLGICPGNVGMTTYFDMARRESQRDFADSVGTNSRALVEGLFGIKPDALKKELLVEPGFPPEWNYAKLRHPDFNFSFKRENLTETYIIEPHFPQPLALRLRLPALRARLDKILVNGKITSWKPSENSLEQPQIEINSPVSSRYEVVVKWKGEKIASVSTPKIVAENAKFEVNFGSLKLLEIADPQKALSNLSQRSSSFSAKSGGLVGHRTIFAKVRQGDLLWQQPLMFEIRPAFEIMPNEEQAANLLRFTVRNNTPQAIDKTADITVNGSKKSLALKIPAFGESNKIEFNTPEISAGANQVKIDLGNGPKFQGIVTNWKIKSDSAKFETIDLRPVFNDKVTNIFKNEYLSPRSPYVSLAIPKQGIGSWAHWDEKFEIDDAGLRETADKNDGKLLLPNGVMLKTIGTGGEKNIAFTSQWDNFPHEISVPLGGRATHVYLLMAGSTNQMQSRFQNGEIIVTYADQSTERLRLENPINWWAIDQDYLIDDFAFRRPEALPPRVDLKTGQVRMLDLANFKGQGGKIPGGAATVLDLPLDGGKELKSLTVRALANEVVIGLMSVTLMRN